MADITMCQDGECPSSSECHRFCAVPDDNQSYSDFWRHREQGSFECSYFIKRRVGDRTQHQQVRITSMGMRLIR